MSAFLLLLLIACAFGACAGMLVAFGLWLWLLATLLNALVVQVPRGIWLFMKLVAWLLVKPITGVCYLWTNAHKRGLRLAQAVYIWLFVWLFVLQERYVSGELRRRQAM